MQQYSQATRFVATFWYVRHEEMLDELRKKLKEKNKTHTQIKYKLKIELSGNDKKMGKKSREMNTKTSPHLIT